MPRNKKLYLNDAVSHLQQATNILGQVEELSENTIHELRSAAVQAQQATAALYLLIGAIDASGNKASG